MKLTPSLRLSYLILILVIFLLIALGLANPYGNGLLQAFYLGLSEALIAAILVLLLVDRIIASNQQKESKKRRTIAVRGLRFALRQELMMLSGMFKASVAKQHEKEYRNPADLFDDYYIEQVGFLDFSKKSPVIPDTSWYEYLANESTKFKEQLNLTLTKFSTDIDAEMLKALEELVNSPFLSFLIQARMIPVIDHSVGFSRSQNLLMGLGPIVKDYVEAFTRLLELYNNSVEVGDRVVLDQGLWRTDVAPKIGDSRVAVTA